MLEAGAAAALVGTSREALTQSRILPEQSLLNALDTQTLPSWKEGLERCRKFLTDDTVHAGGANQLTVFADESRDSRVQWSTPHANEARSPRLVVRRDSTYTRSLNERARITVRSAEYIDEINRPGASRDRSGYQSEMLGGRLASAMRDAEKTGIYPVLPLTESDLAHFRSQVGPASYLWYMGDTRAYGSDGVTMLASISPKGMWYARPQHQLDGSNQAYLNRLPAEELRIREAFHTLQDARAKLHEALQQHTTGIPVAEYHALSTELRITDSPLEQFEQMDASQRTRMLARLVLACERIDNKTQKGARTEAFLASLSNIDELILVRSHAAFTLHDILVSLKTKPKPSLDQQVRSIAAVSSVEELKPDDYENLISAYRTAGFDAEFIPKDRMGDTLPSAVFQ